MSGKNKLKEDQIWLGIFCLSAITILSQAGKEFADNGIMQMVYAGIFGGIGGLIGSFANHLTKGKSTLTKILASLLIVFSCSLFLYFISRTETDEEILKKEWAEQKIGMLEFDSPSNLKLESIEIPDTLNTFYKDIKIYTDGQNDRITTFIKAKIKPDSISVVDAYSGALEKMLSKLQVNIDDVELEVYSADENEVSSMFTFDLNGQKVNGYGCMFYYKDRLESLWLMPITRGFSQEYIEEFELGIFPDFEE